MAWRAAHLVSVQFAELKERADEIARRVQDRGEPVEIVNDGQAVAKLERVAE